VCFNSLVAFVELKHPQESRSETGKKILQFHVNRQQVFISATCCCHVCSIAYFSTMWAFKSLTKQSQHLNMYVWNELRLISVCDFIRFYIRCEILYTWTQFQFKDLIVHVLVINYGFNCCTSTCGFSVYVRTGFLTVVCGFRQRKPPRVHCRST